MKAETPTNRAYLDIADTADLMGFSQKKVRQLVKSGTIPAAQIGRQWIIPRAKLEAMIEELTIR